MLKLNFILALLFFGSFHARAQYPVKFDPENYNRKYLEHLVKSKIDIVRKDHECETLVNDSILYVAATHHSEYMRKKRRISHKETDSTLTYSPQDRVNYFGATNYAVGENVLFMPYNSKVKGKSGKTYETFTYEGLAEAIVQSWVHSPGHFRNMITPEYQVTGLSLAIDTVKNKIYACQKFATVYYQYEFLENKKMFPYSSYTPPVLATSFSGIDSALIAYKYDFKLRHDKPEECISCDQLAQSPPYITLRVEKNNFILKIENSAYVKELIDHRLDGFAVEIVTFDDYMCGNPDYYTKPSRRNGQLKLNGFLLEPVYRKDLQRGFKKRKKRKDINYLSYIFKADSISFFKRFGRYKLDKYDHQYFEFKLGRVPKDLNGYWAHNLAYIQNRQICHIDYFTGYCGELFEEYQETSFIPVKPECDYKFIPEQKEFRFVIPFERGKSEFTKEDIAPFIETLNNLSYEILKMDIQTYASVEGDSLINNELQTKRAESIVNILKQSQSKSFPVTIQTSTDWKGFRSAVTNHPRWKYLSNLEGDKLQEELSRIKDEIEPLLSKERRGEITMRVEIKADDNNLEYLVKEEIKKLHSKIKESIKKGQRDEDAFDKFSRIYSCTHFYVSQGLIAPDFLAGIKMPETYTQHHTLTQKYVLFGYEYEKEFRNNIHWVENHKRNEDDIISSCEQHILPEFIYIFARHLLEHYIEYKNADLEKIQHVLNVMEQIRDYYEEDSIAEVNIDRMNFNLNMLLLNQVFDKEPTKYSGNAIRSMAQLYKFYEKYDQLTTPRVINLAKMAVNYQNISQAVNILTPHAQEDSILSYLMPLGYDHPSNDHRNEYYSQLIELSDQMNEDIWCNMFIRECGIPFQAFDHEALRDLFCEKCLEKNKMIQQLLNAVQTATGTR